MMVVAECAQPCCCCAGGACCRLPITRLDEQHLPLSITITPILTEERKLRAACRLRLVPSAI
jgi:hypothetical protein